MLDYLSIFFLSINVILIIIFIIIVYLIPRNTERNKLISNILLVLIFILIIIFLMYSLGITISFNLLFLKGDNMQIKPHIDIFINVQNQSLYECISYINKIFK